MAESGDAGRRTSESTSRRCAPRRRPDGDWGRAGCCRASSLRRYPVARRRRAHAHRAGRISHYRGKQGQPAWNNISGVVTVGVQEPVRATSRYWASAIDGVMIARRQSRPRFGGRRRWRSGLRGSSDPACWAVVFSGDPRESLPGSVSALV